MLSKKGNKGTETVFNEWTLGWLIVLVTVFLQLISLATTFEGSKVYFGGVKLPLMLSAPLLFALAIQLIVFCMSHMIRRYFKPWLAVVLIMATLCSTYFSYIGIYNHINSPLDYLEERYKQIQGNISDQYQLVVDQSENNMKQYVFDMVGALDQSHTKLVKEVKENNKLMEAIDGIKVDTGKINPQTNALSKPNIKNYGDNLDQYYADMAKYNAAVGNMITDTTKQDADLKNQLYENEVSTLLGGKSKDEFIKGRIETQTQKEQTDKLVQSMYKLIAPTGEEKDFDKQLMAIQDYCIGFIITAQGDANTFSTVLTNLSSQLIQLGSNLELKDFKKDLNYFGILKQKDQSIMLTLEQVKAEVYKEVNGTDAGLPVVLNENDAMLLYTKMQSQIKSAAYLLNQIEGLDEQVDLTSAEYQMHNLYVLPIKNLIEDSSVKAMAWFCLAFAVLIDGLTLVFAMIEGREKTVLFAKRNKDVVGRSKEAIEELLLTTLMTHHKDSEGLTAFLDQFELLPEGLESGYSMWCPLKDLGQYNSFLAVICQFNFGAILSAREIVRENGVVDDTDEKYVLLKTKFVIWLSQKIVQLNLLEEDEKVVDWNPRLLPNEEDGV
ncbi:MAG: hypothetical protein ACRCW2_03760 [Cellulosilyticaceae bacterium]